MDQSPIRKLSASTTLPRIGPANFTVQPYKTIHVDTNITWFQPYKYLYQIYHEKLNWSEQGINSNIRDQYKLILKAGLFGEDWCMFIRDLELDYIFAIKPTDIQFFSLEGWVQFGGASSKVWTTPYITHLIGLNTVSKGLKGVKELNRASDGFW